MYGGWIKATVDFKQGKEKLNGLVRALIGGEMWQDYEKMSDLGFFVDCVGFVA